MKDNLVIFGSSGFIGTNLIEEIKKGDKKYIGFSSKEIDLLDSKSVFILGHHINSTSSLVILSALTRQKGDNLKTCEENIRMIMNLAKILEKQKIAKCIFISTSDVYGFPKKLPISEETPIDPKTFYAISKYISEKILEKVFEKTDTKFYTLRLDGIFGPGQKNIQYGINQFIKSAIDNKVVELWGDGQEKRDPIYVKDIARLITKFAIGNYPSGVYNLVSGKKYSFKSEVKLIEKILPFKFKIVKKKRTGISFNQEFNNNKLLKIFPGFKFTDIKKAIEETYESIK